MLLIFSFLWRAVPGNRQGYITIQPSSTNELSNTTIIFNSNLTEISAFNQTNELFLIIILVYAFYFIHPSTHFGGVTTHYGSSHLPSWRRPFSRLSFSISPHFKLIDAFIESSLLGTYFFNSTQTKHKHSFEPGFKFKMYN